MYGQGIASIAFIGRGMIYGLECDPTIIVSSSHLRSATTNSDLLV